MRKCLPIVRPRSYRSRTYNGIGLELLAEDGAGRLLGVVDGQRDERRADDAEHELQLAAGHGARLARAGPVGGVRPHPRLHVGAAELGPAGPAAAAAGEHLLGDGHLQHRVQRVIALEVRAELPHQTGRAPTRRTAHCLPLLRWVVPLPRVRSGLTSLFSLVWCGVVWC